MPDFEKIKFMIIEKGIKERVEKYIDEMLEEAKDEVKKLGMNDRATSLLLFLIGILAGRES
jgi:geranylgeranyl pyrophosphate synthase